MSPNSIPCALGTGRNKHPFTAQRRARFPANLRSARCNHRNTLPTSSARAILAKTHSRSCVFRDDRTGPSVAAITYRHHHQHVFAFACKNRSGVNRTPADLVAIHAPQLVSAIIRLPQPARCISRSESAGPPVCPAARRVLDYFRHRQELVVEKSGRNPAPSDRG